MRERPNETWWAEHGQFWRREVARRREAMPYYLLQEALLSAYCTACDKPLRVLDFGCGFGRHLQYLRDIAGVEVHGCDQSPTMLACIEDWSEPAWRDQRLRLVCPGQPLPYADGQFDLVFTVSVLIHVRPDDLHGLLGELRRVTRGHLLHLENAPTEVSVLTSAEHEGCWAHPLVKLYRDLGLPAEPLPPIGTIQGLYRAVVDPGVCPPPDIDNLTARLRAIDESALRLRGELQQVPALQQRVQALEAQVAELERRLADQQTHLAAQQAHLADQQVRLADQQAHLAVVEQQRQALLANKARFDETFLQLQRLAATQRSYQRAMRQLLDGGR